MSRQREEKKSESDMNKASVESVKNERKAREVFNQIHYICHISYTQFHWNFRRRCIDLTRDSLNNCILKSVIYINEIGRLFDRS